MRRASARAEALAPQAVAFRLLLHRHPERSGHETGTTQRVSEALTGLGLEVHLMPKGNGCWTTIGHGSPVLGLRADIDALPIEDAKTVAYRSEYRGLCHACGHDAHTAILLTTVQILKELESELEGSVVAMFQPEEEVMGGGAEDFIAEGVLENIQAVYALHCDPSRDVGKIGLRYGPITASVDEVAIAIIGPGGHTARPNQTVNLTEVMSRVVLELPRLVTEELPGLNLTFGVVKAGAAVNIIPSKAIIAGTARTKASDEWEKARSVVGNCLEKLLADTDASFDIDYTRGDPPIVNDPAATRIAEDAVVRVLGPDATENAPQSMGGDDFGWMARATKACYMRLGTRTPGEPEHRLHSPVFDIDERALPIGVQVMTAIALGGLTALTTRQIEP